MSRLLAKVCGLTSATDVAMARAAGADLFGFVRHPDSPRHCADLIAASAGVGAQGVLVIVSDDVESILAQARASQLGWVQPYVAAEKRAAVVATLQAQGLHVLLPWPDEPDQQPIPADLSVWETSRTQTGVHGGSGQGHAMQFPPPGPFLLAGGIDGDNVTARIAQLPLSSRPLLRGADAASRLECAPSVKSSEKISAYTRAVHAIPF